MSVDAQIKFGSLANIKPSLVEVLRNLGRQPREAVDVLFRGGILPPQPCVGIYQGAHWVSPGLDAPISAFTNFATLNLWRSKVFVPERHCVIDIILGFDLGVRAKVYVAPLASVLLAKEGLNLTPDSLPVVDQRPSLITDYGAFPYGPILKVLHAGVRGFVDEFRQIEWQGHPLLLGRSIYRGMLWGYVFLTAG